MGRIKTLLHVHTDYSFDSRTSPEALVRAARREGIGCVAITDHDTIDGALHVAAIADFKVIVGEEVSTCDGHLIGLFMREHIPAGMSARETALAIRDQGGLVFAPHPFVRFAGCGLGKALGEILDLIDAVEVNNAQNLLPGPDHQARRFAEIHGLPQYVGADSHVPESLAPCYQYLPPFEGPLEFLQSCKVAEWVRGRHPLAYFVAAAWRTMLYHAGIALPKGFGAHHVAAPGTGAYPSVKARHTQPA